MSIVRPVIESLQALERGEAVNMTAVSGELTKLSEQLSKIPNNCDAVAIRERVALSNVKLSQRWDCCTMTYYDWIKPDSARHTMLYFLLIGAEVNLANKKHTYSTVVGGELEELCNSYGFQVVDVCRAAGIARNTLKNYMHNVRYIKRGMDLLEGFRIYQNGEM